tara:strand:- start:274 stop:420 length:147 start_codon:yes stop_codon:yes gene_type:complete
MEYDPCKMLFEVLISPAFEKNLFLIDALCPLAAMMSNMFPSVSHSQVI